MPQVIYFDHLLLFFLFQIQTEQSLSPGKDSMLLWNTTPDDNWHTFDARAKDI
jgi:hypothetical protein